MTYEFEDSGLEFLHTLNFQLLINMVGGGGNSNAAASQASSSKVSRLARVVLGNRNSGDFFLHDYYVKILFKNLSNLVLLSSIVNAE